MIPTDTLVRDVLDNVVWLVTYLGFDAASLRDVGIDIRDDVEGVTLRVRGGPPISLSGDPKAQALRVLFLLEDEELGNTYAYS